MSYDDGLSAPIGIDWRGGGNVGIVQYDRSMIVMFYNRPTHNPTKSAAKGSPIYEDVVYVRIHPPGERLNIIDRAANDSDKQRFPMQWQQFRSQKQQIPEGTPIDLLFPETPSVAAMLRANSIHTIEQCAELSANAIENIGMGAQSYVNAAVKYLSAANRGVKTTEFRIENERKDQEIKILKRQVEELKQTVQKITDNKVNGGVDLQQLQMLLSGVMQRPQLTPAQPFDAATAQINATHPTRELAPTKTKRQRPKLTI